MASSLERQLTAARLQVQALGLLLEDAISSAGGSIDKSAFGAGRAAPPPGGVVSLAQLLAEGGGQSAAKPAGSTGASWADITRSKGHEQAQAPRMPEPPVSPEDQPIYAMLKRFVLDPTSDVMCTPTKFSSHDRRRVHVMANLFGLGHKSVNVASGKDGVAQGDKVGHVPQTPYQHSRSHHLRVVKVFKKAGTHAEPQEPEALPPKEWDAEMMEYHRQLQLFLVSRHKEMEFPDSLSSQQRRKVHDVAEHLNLEHESFGHRDKSRVIRVTKVDPKVLAKRLQNSKLLKVAIEAHRQLAVDAAKSAQEEGGVKGSSAVMETKFYLRYVNWNIEWMNHLFASDTEFKDKAPAHGISDGAALLARITAVIKDMNPDVWSRLQNTPAVDFPLILAVQEGPKNIARMRLYVDKYLDGRYTYEVFGGFSQSDQQVFVLVSKDGPVKNAHIFKEGDDYLAEPWLFDVDGNFELEEYTYTRRPVIVECDVSLPLEVARRMKGGAEPEASGMVTRKLYVCAMHAKSKFISGGERLWKSHRPTDRRHFVEKAVKNRRRINAECSRLRKCLNKHVYSKEADPLVVVSGDINDGPTGDLFEDYYLLMNCVDALLGTPFDQNKLLRAVLISKRHVPKADQWSCSFDDYVSDIQGKRVLLDHICVSEAVWDTMLRCGVGHDVFQRHSTGGARQKRPSDHRPVYADLF